MKVPQGQLDDISPIQNWIRDRLKNIRLARGLTQEQLGVLLEHECAGGSRVSDFETGRNDFKGSTMLRHARSLAVSMDRLFVGCPRWGRSKTDEVVILGRDRLLAILGDHTSPSIVKKIVAVIDAEAAESAI